GLGAGEGVGSTRLVPTLPRDHTMNRRTFLGTALGAAATGGLRPPLARANAADKVPTKFQIACMTLPYSRFTLNRALEGIKGAGYKFVAWGTSHNEDGKNVPVMAA